MENTKKKVLFVIDTLQMGGAEQSLLNNVIRFRDMQPVVCHLYAGELLKPKFTENGITVYSVGLQKKYGFLSAYKQLKKIIQKEQPDIMVAYLTRSEIVTRTAGRFNRIPVIGTFVSDLYSDSYNSTLSFKAKAAVSFFKFLNKTTGRFCTGYIANSEAIKQSNAIQLKVPLEKIAVINRGRDSKLFTFRSPQTANGKPLRFINVGRLVPVKGQRDLILSFKNFLKESPGSILHIAGDGPEKDSLLSLIKEQHLDSNVSLLGNRNDIPQLLSNYDCFIFPSNSEGFSGSVVEAMFAGLPVLASDIPVNKEVIDHLQTGYLFEKGSTDSITNAMLWLKDNQPAAASMAIRAHEHAKQNFELSVIAQKIENYLLKKIIEKK
jgi:glycosyltransferase involved in cell wall biosynthesis